VKLTSSECLDNVGEVNSSHGLGILNLLVEFNFSCPYNPIKIQLKIIV